jgi:hypothetical protein
MGIISWLTGLLSYRNKEKNMDFTILYDDKGPSFTSGSNIQEIFTRLESAGEDYVEVVPGHKKIPPNAVKKFNSDPMAVLLSQITDDKPAQAPITIPHNGAPAAIKGTNTFPDKKWVPPVQEEKIKTKYFEEDGISFKLVGDILYKKKWVENKDARLINRKSGKSYSGDNYIVQTQNWKVVSGTPETT